MGEYPPAVLGDRLAVIVEIRRFDIHGSGFVDVTVVFPDRSTATARLGAESVPAEVEPGDHVRVSMAMNMIVAIERSADQEG
jgi:hypothetical protein